MISVHADTARLHRWTLRRDVTAEFVPVCSSPLIPVCSGMLPRVQISVQLFEFIHSSRVALFPHYCRSSTEPCDKCIQGSVSLQNEPKVSQSAETQRNMQVQADTTDTQTNLQ